MGVLKSHSDVDSTVDLFLSDPCQLCAEGCQDRVEGGLDVSLKGRLDCLRFHVNDHDREFNDFLGIHLHVLVVIAGTLEVIDADVIKWRLVKKLMLWEVQDISEVLNW